jgi:chorismate mutase
MMLKNTPGVLSSILNRVAQLGANVLTINQNLPIHGAAYVTISLSVEELNVSVDDMLREFKKVDGVLGAEIVGKS